MLPWLEAPLAEVLQVHAAGRLPHALLVQGGAGWGEVALADELCRHLLGLDEVASVKAVAHPDLRWVEPDGAVIKVDDIREVAAFAVGTRQIAPSKVVVIQEAELMNASAANALLKTLEEPPPDTYILLTSARPGRLLPTIVSRCQSVSISRNLEAARVWLADQWPDAALDDTLFECGDAPLSVHGALSESEPPLGPTLASLARPGTVSSAVPELLGRDVDRLTAAWYRHCVALLAGQQRIPGVSLREPRRLLDFADELG